MFEQIFNLTHKTKCKWRLCFHFQTSKYYILITVLVRLWENEHCRYRWYNCELAQIRGQFNSIYPNHKHTYPLTQQSCL